jgi:hypothetical protein
LVLHLLTSSTAITQDASNVRYEGVFRNKTTVRYVRFPFHFTFSYYLFPLMQQPLVGHGLLIIKASRWHSDTPHSVGLLWTSDQPDAETSTWQHTTVTRDRHPYLRRDSNPQSQQANGRRPTP